MPRKRIIPIFVPHLGCPHQCVFCNQKSIAGCAAPPSGAEVQREIERALAICDRAEVAFYGGSFTAIDWQQQEVYLQATAPFLKTGQVSSLRISTRPDAVDEKTLSRLQRCGVKTVELGCQSMSDAVLQHCERGHSVQDTLRAASLVQKAGLNLVLQMMTGLPGSCEETDLETGQRLAALHPQAVRIYPTVVLRDSALHQAYLEGRYRPQTLQEAVHCCALLRLLFLERGIPVLRMGLQPTSTLSGGEAVAGPYHPAFGELVLSRVLLMRAQQLLDQVQAAQVTLLVHPRQYAAMIGQKRENVYALLKKYPEKTIRIAKGDCQAWEIRLQLGEKIDTIT